MGFLKKLIAFVNDFSNRDKYKKANKIAIINSVMMEESFNEKPNKGPYTEHPFHKIRLKQYIKNVEEFNKLSRANKTTIAFGDSILDIPRTKFTSINERLNFAISGSWAHHMEQMAVDIFHFLYQKGLNIKYIVIGTLGGNPLLGYQDIDATVTISYNCLERIRRIFPYSKIIVYGLPPVYNKYATKHSFKFESKIYEWVVKDDNSVFIPMFSKFGEGFFNLIPNVKNSSDGINLTHTGVLMLDNLIEIAKSAKAKSIVD